MAKKKSTKSKSSARSKKSTRQQKPNKTIGILHSGSAGYVNDPSIKAFIAVLDKNGYTVNKNLTLDPSTPLWSDDNPTLLADNAKKLATNSKLNLIIAAGGPPSVYAILKAQNDAKTNTNVVFTSFSQLISPASNMTGVDARTSDLDGTRLKMLYDLAQKAPKLAGQKTFGVLENNKRNDYDATILDGVAAGLKINKPERFPVTPGPNKQAIRDLIKNAFQGWKQKGITVALVAADPLFNDFRKEVIQAEIDNSFAAMHQWHEFKDEGGLASYGTDLTEAYQTAGAIAVRVLDGTDPAAIPVQPLTNIKLSINRATAKRLGLKIS